MEIISNISKLHGQFVKPVVAIGIFDGLHVGHQHLIDFAVRRARQTGGTAIVLTFAPHPIQVLYPQRNLQLIVSLPHRVKLIEQHGVDVCIIIRFTKMFSRLSPEIFIQKYLVQKIEASEVIVGDDFRFGKDRAGTLALFKQAGLRHGFKVHAIKALEGGKKLVSSSKIRELIGAGKIKRAVKLLGRPVAILGQVVHGDSRGKKLGFPTANIKTSDIVFPPTGVYIAQVILNGKKLPAVANVGCRPSFSKNKKIIIEVHIFNFTQEIYGRDIVVEFLQKIRSEKRFLSREALIAQIKRDIDKARKFFSHS